MGLYGHNGKENGNYFFGGEVYKEVGFIITMVGKTC